MKICVWLLILSQALFKIGAAIEPDWEYQEFNSILNYDPENHTYECLLDDKSQGETWWLQGTPSDVRKMVAEGKSVPAKKKTVITLRTDCYRPENWYGFAAMAAIQQKKTKIALIAPQVPAGKSLGIVKSPESIQALAGQLERLGFNVRMYQSSLNGELFSAIRKFSPNFVGISTMTVDFPEGHRIAQVLKRKWPLLPIVLGGWHASGCVQAHLLGQESETLAELLNVTSPFDFVVAGEGEEVLPKLLRSLEEGRSVEGIEGVSFFRNGTIHVNGSTPRINDLGRLAKPSWKGLNVDQYRDMRTGDLDLSVHYNRGCRFRCGFCSTPVVYGKGVKVVPANQAIRNIEYILKKFHPQTITFTDEDFFAKPDWVNEMVSQLERKDLAGRYRVSFDTFASINDILRHKNDGLLGRMKKVGFGSFTVGIESFNADALSSFNKELMILPMMTNDERSAYWLADADLKKSMLIAIYRNRVQEAINFALDHGILVCGDYMVGSPGESEDDVRAGFDIFKNLENLFIAYIPVFTPFPGTPIWKETFHSGLLPRTDNNSRVDWERFNASAGALNTGYDIGRLRDELEVEFYTSKRYSRDMQNAHKRNPKLARLFLGRFEHLHRTFPSDQRVFSKLSDLLV